MIVDLKALAARIYTNSARQGWWHGSNMGDKQTPAEIRFKLTAIALMHSELGEATEGVRKPRPDDHCPVFTNEVIELADTVIRILDYCYHYGLPLEAAICAKVAANESRPLKHGKEY